MRTPRPEIIERLREGFPAGCRVALLRMDDVQAPPIGTLGTVVGVDSVGTIHVNWDKRGFGVLQYRAKEYAAHCGRPF